MEFEHIYQGNQIIMGKFQKQSTCFQLKSNFLNYKELLTQAYTRKLCVDTQKSLCTQDNVNQSKQSCVYTTISRDFLCQHSVSHLLFNGQHKINLSKCALIFCVNTWEFSWVHSNVFVSTQCLLITLEWLTQHGYSLCWHKKSIWSKQNFLEYTRTFLCWHSVGHEIMTPAKPKYRI